MTVNCYITLNKSYIIRRIPSNGASVEIDDPARHPLALLYS